MADGHANLVAALRDAGRDIDLPPGDPAAVALGRIRAPGAPGSPRSAGPGPAATGRGRARWPALAAAVAVVVAALVLAAPGARQAVARLLGIGGVRVTLTGEAPGELARSLDLGDPLPVDEALAAGGGAFGPAFPSPPGDPALAFTGRPADAVSLVWPAGEGLPALEGSDAGLMLTAFPTGTGTGTGEPGAPGTPPVEKEVGPGGRITAVHVGPHPAYWLSGAPHEVREGAPSGGGPEGGTGARLAGNTLVWSAGGTTYRLESALDRAAAVTLAEALTGITG